MREAVLMGKVHNFSTHTAFNCNTFKQLYNQLLSLASFLKCRWIKVFSESKSSQNGVSTGAYLASSLFAYSGKTS